MANSNISAAIEAGSNSDATDQGVTVENETDGNSKNDANPVHGEPSTSAHGTGESSQSSLSDYEKMIWDHHKKTGCPGGVKEYKAEDKSVAGAFCHYCKEEWIKEDFDSDVNIAPDCDFKPVAHHYVPKFCCLQVSDTGYFVPWKNIDKLKKGDHIAWLRFPSYWHHAIVSKVNEDGNTINVIEWTKDGIMQTQRNKCDLRGNCCYSPMYKVAYPKEVETQNPPSLVLLRANARRIDKTEDKQKDKRFACFDKRLFACFDKQEDKQEEETANKDIEKQNQQTRQPQKKEKNAGNTKLRKETEIKDTEKTANKDKYHLLMDNCEHFATFCKTGSHKCNQLFQYKVSMRAWLARFVIAALHVGIAVFFSETIELLASNTGKDLLGASVLIFFECFFFLLTIWILYSYDTKNESFNKGDTPKCSAAFLRALARSAFQSLIMVICVCIFSVFIGREIADILGEDWSVSKRVGVEIGLGILGGIVGNILGFFLFYFTPCPCCCARRHINEEKQSKSTTCNNIFEFLGGTAKIHVLDLFVYIVLDKQKQSKLSTEMSKSKERNERKDNQGKHFSRPSNKQPGKEEKSEGTKKTLNEQPTQGPTESPDRVKSDKSLILEADSQRNSQDTVAQRVPSQKKSSADENESQQGSSEDLKSGDKNREDAQEEVKSDKNDDTDPEYHRDGPNVSEDNEHLSEPRTKNQNNQQEMVYSQLLEKSRDDGNEVIENDEANNPKGGNSSDEGSGVENHDEQNTLKQEKGVDQNQNDVNGLSHRNADLTIATDDDYERDVSEA